MIGIDVSIAIKCDTNSEPIYLVLPVIPTTLKYTDGAATPVSVNILDLGRVEFSNGVDLDSLSWSCFFPARYDPAYCTVADMKTPLHYRNQLSNWKDAGRELQVIIPAAGINKTMKVQSFTWEFKGFEGDLYYQIIFKEYKKILPLQVNNAAVTESTPKRDPLPATVEIKKGDKVKFTGGGVYTSSNAANATANRKEALCDCTLTYNGKHPYHLIHYSGDIVYGWVDASNCKRL